MVVVVDVVAVPADVRCWCCGCLPLVLALVSLLMPVMAMVLAAAVVFFVFKGGFRSALIEVFQFIWGHRAI